MKKLSKEQLKRHEDLSAELHGAHEELDGAIKLFNETVSEAFGKLATYVDDFNSKVADANAFVEEIHAEQESYEGDKTDTWREGDAGSAYADWMSAWEVSIEEVELDEPPELDTPDIDLAEFDGLDTECPS